MGEVEGEGLRDFMPSLALRCHVPDASLEARASFFIDNFLLLAMFLM